VRDLWGAAKPREGDWPQGALTLAGHCLRQAVTDYLDEDFRRDAGAAFGPEALDHETHLNRTARNAVMGLRTLERAMEVEYAMLVALIRFEGESWSDVGKLLGISKQAAQNRFGKIATQIQRVCTANGSIEAIAAAFPHWGISESRTHELASVLTDFYRDTGHQGWSFDLPNSSHDYLDRPFTEDDAIYFDDQDDEKTAEGPEGGVAVDAGDDLEAQFNVDDLPF
jgi:hypothetical protein